MDLLEKLVAAYPESIGASAWATDLLYQGVTPVHVLLSNPNIYDMIGILQHLIETHPSRFRETSGKGRTSPIHIAVQNKSVDASIIQLLINAWPESLQLRSRDNMELEQLDLPIHTLCGASTKDAAAVGIIELLIKEFPASVQAPDKSGYLPIHLAVMYQSTQFCQVLVNAYPESVRVGTPDYRCLPIHLAIEERSKYAAETVQYLMEYDPESLLSEDVRGYTPLHRAAGDSQIIKLILSRDLSLAKVQTRGEDWFGYDRLELPIHNACSRWIGRAQQTVDTIKKAVQVLFDAYPEGLFARSVNVNSRGEVSRHTPLETAHDTIRQQNRHQ